jgi:hypothetical protein
LWKRFISGCSSALMVIWVNEVATLPSASRHSRHNPATKKGASSAMPMPKRSAFPLS